ncbi:MAG: hypothetical protein E7B11_10075 [Clostridiales bacterium]|nr:hypothetical protein [Clostridiales bacterium]MDU3240900.1 hypothetical protein [Clostridiales bacterium]
MKKTIIMFVFTLFFLGLFFYVKAEAHLVTGTGTSVLADTSGSSYTYGQPRIFAKLTPADTPAGIQEKVPALGITNYVEERNNQRPFNGSVLAILLYIATNVLLGSGRSSLFWILSICLTFSCILISQVQILHQSDGKKRTVIF